MSNSFDMKQHYGIALIVLKERKKYMRGDRRKLYKPLSRCGDNASSNLYHNEYVYKRESYDLHTGLTGGIDTSEVLSLADNEPCVVSSSGIVLPCIKLWRLNDIIKEDQQLLIALKEDAENQITMRNEQMKGQPKEIAKLKVSTFNSKYTKDFLSQLEEVISHYANLQFTKGDIMALPIECKKSIHLGSYHTKFLQDIAKETKGHQYQEPIIGSTLYDDISSFMYPTQMPDNQELRKGRDLLQQIMQQIVSIEMKTQMNKTKINTLVSQYTVLRRIRQTIDKRINGMQKRINDLNEMKQQRENKIEDLQSKIRSLERSKENLKREIKEIIQENDLRASEKNRKISELNKVKASLERQNMEYKRQIMMLKQNRQIIEEQNRRFQKDLKEAKAELKETEKVLGTISGKLDGLNVKVDKNKTNLDEIAVEKIEDLQLKDELTPMPSLKDDIKKLEKTLKPKKTRKPRKSRKTSPKELESESSFILPESPEEPAQKPKRARKPRRKAVNPVQQPKRRRGRPKGSRSRRTTANSKKSRNVRVKVNRKRRRNPETQSVRQEESFIFDISLRDLMG